MSEDTEDTILAIVSIALPLVLVWASGSMGWDLGEDVAFQATIYSVFAVMTLIGVTKSINWIKRR